MLRVELPAFFEKDETRSLRAELVVAKAFATAATAVSASDCRCVKLDFSCTVADHVLGGNPEPRCSQRALRDAFLLLVDRAVARIYPPVDVLQYLSDRSPQFTWDGAFRVVFFLESIPPHSCVSAQLSPTCDAHAVVYTVEGAAAPFFEMQHNLETEIDGSRRASPLEQHLLKRDSELWFHAKLSSARARVGNDPPQDSHDCSESVHSDTSRCLGREEGNHEVEMMANIAERLATFHKKAVLWLTERLANEGSWAKPSGSFSATSNRDRKRGRQGIPNSAATNASLTVPYHPNLLAAAAASFSLPSQKENGNRPRKENFDGMRRSRTLGDGSSPVAVSCLLHSDVRGIEFNAVLVAQTARYAYVACLCAGGGGPGAEFTVSSSSIPMALHEGNKASPAQQATHWCLVARLPIPCDLATAPVEGEGEKNEGESIDGTVNNVCEHFFVTGGGAAGASKSSRFLQLEEAARFDNSGPLRELCDARKRLLTVRAHRVRCRRLPGTVPVTSPFTFEGAPLLLWFEDAYCLGSAPFPMRCAGSSEETAAEKPLKVDGGSSCSDLLELVEASCRRYLRTCEKMSRYVRAPLAPLKDEDIFKLQRVDTVESDGRCEAEEKSSPSSYEDAAALQCRTKLRSGKQRLVTRADAIFSTMTDTRSVYYKKLRNKQFHAFPLVRTSRDVEGLFEGPTVEFKHHLNHYRAAMSDESEEGPSIGRRVPGLMDVERIRHTIAAMASTRGGVLCVGVTDEGEAVGHARGEVVRALRTTGFCPAMVNGSVLVKELPVLSRSAALNTADPTGSAAPVKTMPKDWWKISAAPSSAVNVGEGEDPRFGGDQRGDGMKTTVQAHFEKVVTIITVSKGSAPFYASGRAVLPYLRGCASTVRMPTLVMARRLAGQLEGEATCDS